MANIPNEILPQILVLIQSPLLQGGALGAMLEFFQAIVGLPKLGFKDLLQMLIKPVYNPTSQTHHQAFSIHKQVMCICNLYLYKKTITVIASVKDRCMCHISKKVGG
jgi:hypothetical protein